MVKLDKPPLQQLRLAVYHLFRLHENVLIYTLVPINTLSQSTPLILDQVVCTLPLSQTCFSVSQELEKEQGDPKWLDIIEKDLHRQFPFHEMFAARGGHG